MVDSKGHNILHIAAKMEREEVIEFILQMSCSSQLINQKSNQGNTPLHLLASSKLVLKMPLMNSDGFWFSFNDKNIHPIDVALSKVRMLNLVAHDMFSGDLFSVDFSKYKFSIVILVPLSLFVLSTQFLNMMAPKYLFSFFEKIIDQERHNFLFCPTSVDLKQEN